MRFKRLFGGLLLAAFLLVVPAVIVSQQQNIRDWLILRSYNPSSRIVALASATTMNDHGRKLFYVHKPELEDKATFNDHCRGAEYSIILGCYISRSGIYIYDVKEPRLNGIHEVTAAHEMLHAAFDRLSPSERSRISTLVVKTFNGLNDARLMETINQYKQSDPGVVPNELHSILATEIRNLPIDLENYYKKYFSDRLKIVSLSELYEKNFTEREEKIKSYDAQLAKLKLRIESIEIQLEKMLLEMKSQRAEMDSLLATGNNQSYNSKVPIYNATVRSYNSRLTQLKTEIETYNNLVAERNAIADEERELIEAIDSRLPSQ